MPRASYRAVPMSLIIEPPAPLRGSHNADRLRELAGSMQALGQLQPIVLQPAGTEYAIIAGHRRYLAAKLLGWEKIEAKVLPNVVSDWEITALAENTHRENLTPVEEARVIYHLVIEQQRDLDQVAERFKKSREWIDGRLELCQYQPDLLEAVQARGISLAVARQLTRVTDDGYRAYLLHYAIENGATEKTARLQVEEWLQAHTPAGQAPTANPGPPPPYQGQAVGIACAHCDELHPIGDLRPLYYCARCLQDYFDNRTRMQKLKDGHHDTHPRQ